MAGGWTYPHGHPAATDKRRRGNTDKRVEQPELVQPPTDVPSSDEIDQAAKDAAKSKE